MSDPWTFAGEPALTSYTGAAVTLVEGSSFAISAADGEIEPGAAQGLFFEDTRFVSTWRLRIDDAGLQNLAFIARQPFAATFVSRGPARADEVDSSLLVERTRYVGDGMREEVVVRNLGREAAACTIAFEVDADFAHLFDVKENRVHERGQHTVDVGRSSLSFGWTYRESSRGLDVVFPDDARVTAGEARLDVVIPAGGAWQAGLDFRFTVDGEAVEPRYQGGHGGGHSAAVARLLAWQQTMPRVRTSDRAFNAVFAQSERDLGALRIFDPEHADRSVIAAGAPWFMTLFGRDSLITSIMTLEVDLDLAAGTLLTLARMQGERSDPLTEEQPGKILHEMRRGLATAAATRAGSAYYGSIDATPLFVIGLGELHRWGAPADVVAELLPHADRALAWIQDFGDLDGDGFVEYRRATSRGLANQGWKDSFDGVSFAGGTLAQAPIALCEVQAYVYAAYLARARIARSAGEASLAEHYEGRASRLKEAFNETFWLPAQGYFAMGLDGEKRPIDALTSNVGHCLWSGIVDEDKAERTAARLSGPDMFTGWGVRTLSSSMARFNPVSYHNGSVWPHDSAICAAGLARYGFIEQAQAIATGLLEAAQAFGGRLPELFCGFERAAFPIPVPYPAACAPQAWASATPFFLMRTTLLRFEPRIPDGVVTCAPAIPGAVGPVSIENLHLAGSRISIRAEAGVATIEGLPATLRQVDATGADR